MKINERLYPTIIRGKQSPARFPPRLPKGKEHYDELV
jgi:hypothetical protein